MALNLNKVILSGRMTADPELKQTNSGTAVLSFTIAVDRRHQKDGEKQTDFINVVAWKQTAEFIAKYFRKGSAICVVGNLQTRTWTDQNGQKRYATEVMVEEANFVESKTDSQANTGGGYIPEAYTAQPHFEEITSEDDLPF